MISRKISGRACTERGETRNARSGLTGEPAGKTLIGWKRKKVFYELQCVVGHHTVQSVEPSGSCLWAECKATKFVTN